LASLEIHEHVGWLDVLVYHATSMQPAEDRGQRDPEPQELTDLHWLTDKRIEPLASRVFDNEHRPTSLAQEFQRPHRPLSVEMVPKFEFLVKPIETLGRGVPSGGSHGRECVTIVIGVVAAYSAEDTLAVHPQDFEFAFPTNVGTGGCLHLSGPFF
jgi:hypothetical protein